MRHFFSFLLSRYVDLTEAIDSHDASFLDNSEFQDADAIPLHEALPTKHYLTNEVCFHLLAFVVN